MQVNTASGKIWKTSAVICCIAAFCWICRGYAEVGILSLKYGHFFEEGYKQSRWFSDYPSIKPRVLRYKDIKATIYTDSGYIRERMQDERENIAVINYGNHIAMCFIYDGNQWVMDTSRGYEDFIMLSSATADNFVWPLYLW